MNLIHLDCNITLTCNKTCIDCSHASPYSKPYWMEPETLRRDLNDLKQAAHFDMICAVGGEPTIHPKLLRFLDVMRESEIADKVCVVTNGTRLKKLPEQFWEKIDILRWSIYGEPEEGLKEYILDKQEHANFELQAWRYPEFFKQLKRIPDDGVESYNNCTWRKDCWTCHESHFYACPQGAFFPERFLGHESNDGLELDGITEEKLQAYMDRTKPFEACKICMAGEKQAFPWRESTSKQDWLSASTL